MTPNLDVQYMPSPGECPRPVPSRPRGGDRSFLDPAVFRTDPLTRNPLLGYTALARVRSLPPLPFRWYAPSEDHGECTDRAEKEQVEGTLPDGVLVQ